MEIDEEFSQWRGVKTGYVPSIGIGTCVFQTDMAEVAMFVDDTQLFRVVRTKMDCD